MDELSAPNGSPEVGPLVAAVETAKLLLLQAIEHNASGAAGVIQLQGRCCDCAAPHISRLPPGTFTGAGLEHSGDNSRACVLGFDAAGVRLALEISHTEVPAVARSQALQVPVIELVAQDVLADPYFWRPVRNTLRARRCYACRTREQTQVGKPGVATQHADSQVAALAPYVDVLEQCVVRPLRRFTR